MELACDKIGKNHMSQFYGDSIFWIELEKIKPNPYQPRHEFDEARLEDLADSIRQYGVLQPLVVTRTEVPKADGGLAVEYELISGERRLRASKLVGLSTVPAIIRISSDDARVKLELAIIENLQREDLNPVDRARAFDRLVSEFNFKHSQIAEKIGKSREYVTNSLRLLSLPPDILDALSHGKITEGHSRPLMMLGDRHEEQSTLFKEIVFKKLTVREAEAIARRIAYDRVRKKDRAFDPELVELEEKLVESLGTRVHIERKEVGGKILIDFFSNDDLRSLLDLLSTNKPKKATEMLENYIAEVASTAGAATAPAPETETAEAAPLAPLDDRSKEDKDKESTDEDLYSIKNFSI
ncbi:MAG: ParB/RepB/Spo0J family partition protein [bacterium]|nr:ParB/RepB/Spo0J family partition protein [bacterium]